MKLKSNANTFAKPLGQMSLSELYMELDGIHWGWKLTASVANWMMLAGFIVLPSAFDDEKSKFRLNPMVLRGVAVSLLLVGYLTTGIICWHFKNILFQVEAIFSPGFTGSLLGMMSSLFNVYGKNYDPAEERWGGTAISAVTLSAVFMVFYGTTAWNGNRKIDLIRQHGANMNILQGQLEDPNLIPTEEHTRRQLLKLLLADQQQNYPQQPPRVPEMVRDPSDQGRREREQVQEEVGVGLPPGLRRDREWRRSGIIMSATVGHGREQPGGNGWWWSPA